MIESILPGKKKTTIINYTAFPETEDKFMSLFFDQLKIRLKTMNFIKEEYWDLYPTIELKILLKFQL